MTEAQTPFSGGGEPVTDKPVSKEMTELANFFNSRMGTTKYLIEPDGSAVELTFTAATGRVTFKNGTETVSLPYKRL